MFLTVCFHMPCLCREHIFEAALGMPSTSFSPEHARELVSPDTPSLSFRRAVSLHPFIISSFVKACLPVLLTFVMLCVK